MHINHIKKHINLLGKSYPLVGRYHFVSLISNTYKIKVKIKNQKSNKTKIIRYDSLKNGNNPFIRQNKKLSENEIKTNVNSWGKSSSKKSEHFQFISMYRDHTNKLKIIVKNLQTNKKKEIRYTDLKNGTNPFYDNRSNLEKNITHKFFKQLFKKNRLNYKYEPIINSNIYTKKRQQVDFIVYNQKNDYIIIETKSELTKYGKNYNKTVNQLESYHNSLISNKKYKGSIVASVEGELYYNPKEALNFIKKTLRL